MPNLTLDVRDIRNSGVPVDSPTRQHRNTVLAFRVRTSRNSTGDESMVDPRDRKKNQSIYSCG